MCCMQSVFWRTGLEGYKWRNEVAFLSEQIAHTDIWKHQDEAVVSALRQISSYLSRADHDWNIRNKRQRTDIRKYSFVNRTVRLWNRLAADIVGALPCKPNTFRKRARNMINGVNWRKWNCVEDYLNGLWSEVKWCEVIWSEVDWSGVKRSEVKWCDVMWSEVMWCVVKWCDVMWYEVKWSEVKWCELKWCDVNWSQVKWCDVN